MQPERPLLEIENLDAYYGYAHVLQGLSLTVGTEPTAIIGRNGMGKTTLFPSLTTDEHLRMLGSRSRGPGAWSVERLDGLFPQLAERLVMVAGRIGHETTSADLKAEEEAQQRFLGVASFAETSA
jgi:branched-chain amino acid transport system ATP-binding protein